MTDEHSNRHRTTDNDDHPWEDLPSSFDGPQRGQLEACTAHTERLRTLDDMWFRGGAIR